MRVLTAVLLIFIFVKPAAAELEDKHCHWLEVTATDSTKSAYRMFETAVEHAGKAMDGINKEANSQEAADLMKLVNQHMASAADFTAVYNSFCKD